MRRISEAVFSYEKCWWLATTKVTSVFSIFGGTFDPYNLSKTWPTHKYTNLYHRSTTLSTNDEYLIKSGLKITCFLSVSVYNLLSHTLNIRNILHLWAAKAKSRCTQPAVCLSSSITLHREDSCIWFHRLENTHTHKQSHTEHCSRLPISEELWRSNCFLTCSTHLNMCPSVFCAASPGITSICLILQAYKIYLLIPILNHSSFPLLFHSVLLLFSASNFHSLSLYSWKHSLTSSPPP